METKSIKRLQEIQSNKLLPLKIKYNITTLNMIIAFILKDSVLRTRKTLNNIKKLFDAIDEDLYDTADLKDRLFIIKTLLYARLVKGFESNNDYIIQYCKDDVNSNENVEKILNNVDSLKITHDESKYLIKEIDDALIHGYILTYKDLFMEILSNHDEDFKSYKAIESDLFSIANSLQAIKRSINSLDSDQTFSLDSDTFDIVIDDAVQKLKDRNRIFLTGMQYLNCLLSPGYISKRLYTFLAFPGKGKSTILLKAALDIKKYNKEIKTKDPDKRPAVLFLTLENDIAETIERIYNMTVDNDDIRNYTPKQIKQKLKKDGQLVITNDNNIDIIIKEYKNRSIDTNDVYTIINDLSDVGVEVIALIVDYMKRIRPAEHASEEKTELKNISNELKEIAKFYDIPVITAQQLNRSSATTVDAALQANKADVTKLVGRDGIAGAWEILENSDVTIIINPEVKQDTSELFMTFKLLKRRYRSTEEREDLRTLDYFNQPFVPGSSIKLIDDIDLPKPVALTSLANTFEAIETKKGSLNAVEREHIKPDKEKKNKNSDLIISEFDSFDIDNPMNF